jgi:hypothetical protein
MKPVVSCIASVAVVVVACLHAASAQQATATRDPATTKAPAEIARMLGSDTQDERDAALAQMDAIPAPSLDPLLLDALLRALDRENARMKVLEATHTEGGGEAEGEYLADMLHLAAQHTDDPRVAAHLVPFVGTGGMVATALENCGDRSVPDLATLATARSTPVSDVVGALTVLWTILEKSPERPISAESRNRMLQVAASRLSRRQSREVVSIALGFAVATGDPQLRERVRQISLDPVVAAGFGLDKEDTHALQQRAAALLK